MVDITHLVGLLAFSGQTELHFRGSGVVRSRALPHRMVRARLVHRRAKRTAARLRRAGRK